MYVSLIQKRRNKSFKKDKFKRYKSIKLTISINFIASNFPLTNSCHVWMNWEFIRLENFPLHLAISTFISSTKIKVRNYWKKYKFLLVASSYAFPPCHKSWFHKFWFFRWVYVRFKYIYIYVDVRKAPAVWQDLKNRRDQHKKFI